MPAPHRAESPKVSVCMLAYNHQPLLPRAIESVLNQQTAFPFEIVIGEDCSTDGTREIVQDYVSRHPEQVRALLRGHNVGIRDNFRETLDACRGEYVAVLEGDDYWTEPLKLHRQVEALDSHPDWSICFHRVQIESSESGPAQFEPAEDDFPTVTSLSDLLRRNFIGTASVMFRHRQFREWPPEFSNLVQQDWPLHVLNAQYGDIGYLPQTMAVYRKHSGGVWSSQSMTQRATWWFEALDAAEDYLSPEFSDDIRQGRLALTRQISEQMDQLLNSRDIRWGRALLKPIRTIRRLLKGSPAN